MAAQVRDRWDGRPGGSQLGEPRSFRSCLTSWRAAGDAARRAQAGTGLRPRMVRRSRPGAAPRALGGFDCPVRKCQRRQGHGPTGAGCASGLDVNPPSRLPKESQVRPRAIALSAGNRCPLNGGDGDIGGVGVIRSVGSIQRTFGTVTASEFPGWATSSAGLWLG